jgi:hypothetical protein
MNHLNYRPGPVVVFSLLRDKRGDRCLFPPIFIAWVALERLGGKNGFRLYIEDLANHITSLNHMAASVDCQRKRGLLF